MTRGSTLRSDCYFNFTGHKDGASESERVSSLQSPPKKEGEGSLV